MSLSAEDLQNPKGLEETIWRLLARGAIDAKHAFKLFSIATINADGLPDTRTVVLRSCDIAAKELCFHTDIRSGKIAHFKKQPEVCLLFWDHKQSLQLRVYGIVSIHYLDEIAIHKLAALPQQQLHLYGYTTTPGSNLDTTAYEIFQDKLIKQNFAWVNVQIHTVDALHLGRTGIHTRVKFQYDGGEILSARYLKA
jgi:pyridoxamine 5'-phosphate oxidase